MNDQQVMEERSEIESEFLAALAVGSGSAFHLGSQIKTPEELVQLILDSLESRPGLSLAEPEETLGRWMLTLAAHLDIDQALEEALIQQVENTECEAVATRGARVLLRLAERGSELAREALYRGFVQQRFEYAGVFGPEIIELDRFEGFLFCAGVIGQRLEHELEFETRGELFLFSCDFLDEKKVLKKLVRRSRGTPSIAIYRDQLVTLGLLTESDDDPKLLRERRGERREIRALSDHAEGSPTLPAEVLLGQSGFDLGDPARVVEAAEALKHHEDRAQLADALIAWSRTSSFPELAPALVSAFRYAGKPRRRCEALRRLRDWKRLDRTGTGVIEDALHDASAEVRAEARACLDPLEIRDREMTAREAPEGFGRFFEFEVFHLSPEFGELGDSSRLEGLLHEILATEEEGSTSQLILDEPAEAIDFDRAELRDLRVTLGDLIEDATQTPLRVAAGYDLLCGLDGLAYDAPSLRWMRPLSLENRTTFEQYDEFFVFSVEADGPRALRFRLGIRFAD